MLLNVWSAKWNGHLIEVRNHCFVAELMIDGQLVHKMPGVFRHDLQATIKNARSRHATRHCPNEDCKHQNTPNARFCAKCGAELPGRGVAHEVRASVEVRFPPPRVICRVLVDGEEVFKEGP